MAKFLVYSELATIVSTLSRPFIGNLDWWVEGPASRNTFASPLYHNLCCLLLVEHLIKNKMFCFSKVLVDNSALQIILIQVFKDFDISAAVTHFPVYRYQLRFWVNANFFTQICCRILHWYVAGHLALRLPRLCGG
jgi:hypothetical protein